MKKILGVVFPVLVLAIAGHLVGATAQPRPPIKIGFTADLTGIAAQPAKDMVNGSPCTSTRSGTRWPAARWS
jgi:hypothetical protein